MTPCPLRRQLLGSDGSSGDIRSVVSGHGVELCSGASGAIRAREALNEGTVSVFYVPSSFLKQYFQVIYIPC